MRYVHEVYKKPGPKDDIDKLITKLGSRKYGIRTKAHSRLKSFGPYVLSYLQKNLQHKDAEIRLRVSRLYKDQTSTFWCLDPKNPYQYSGLCAGKGLARDLYLKCFEKAYGYADEYSVCYDPAIDATVFRHLIWRMRLVGFATKTIDKSLKWEGTGYSGAASDAFYKAFPCSYGPCGFLIRSIVNPTRNGLINVRNRVRALMGRAF